MEKSFGIEMTIYGVNNIPLRRETKWFSSASELAEFYHKNKKKTGKKKKAKTDGDTAIEFQEEPTETG